MRRHRSSSQWESRALFQRMTTPPTETRKKLIDRTIKELKSYGIWYQLDVLYFFAAETQQAALLNWVKRSHDATAVNSPTFTVDRGLTFGATTSANSNINLSTQTIKYTLNNAMVGVYSRTAGAISGNDFTGSDGTNTTQGRVKSGTNFSQIGINALDGDNGGTPASGLGWFTFEREASNLSRVRLAGVSQGTTSRASSALPNADLSFGVGDLRELSVGTIGATLSDSQHYHFNRIIEYYMDAIGAGVQ